MEKEKKDIFEKVWDFFASVKLTIFILIILALTSIIGTIVEQQAEPARNIALLAKFFGDTTAPTVYNIFVKLGFMNMYHSWWFVSLLILFSANLIVCTLERFPKTWKLINAPVRPLTENAIKSLPVRKELSFKTSIQAAKEQISNSLIESKYRVFEATEGNVVQLYTQKGRYSRLGLYVVHVSIIIIFAGAIIGARFGFTGFLNLPEGTNSPYILLQVPPLSKAEMSERGNILSALDTAQGDIGTVSNMLGMPADVLEARMKRYGIKPLGFSVKCNWYNTEYYEDERGRDMPKEFQSELMVIENGREVMKKVVEVNHPLTYRGVTFYQSSYGMVPRAVGKFIIKVVSKDGNEDIFRLNFGETFKIADSDIYGTIVNFSPALARDRQTGALTTYSENMVNPAMAVKFSGTNMREFTGWILKRYPETGIMPDGTQIRFLDYWGVEYTGLQVSKDPGVGLVYFASVIMTIGLYVAFFMSHKKIWVRLTNESAGGKTVVNVTIGGSATKNRLGFEREVEKIFSKVSRALSDESDSPR